MSGFLETAIQNSQGDESIKTETLRILEEAKEIQESVGDENAQREYEEVRLSTIGALTNLRHETRDDLDSIRAELGEGGSIDVYKYAEGDITQSELGNITKEFNDLQEITVENDGVNEVEGNFGSIMLGYIESTNQNILNGGKEELDTQIGWYLTAFGGEGGNGGFSAKAAYIGASAILSGETMHGAVNKLNEIKNSNTNLETKLFQLSKVLYEVGKDAGAPSGLESAHNQATRNIIKKVIESSDNIFAIGYNPEDGGYYVNEGEIDKDNDMEVGTYLCSLNKSGKLNKDNLLEPDGPFSPTELFELIENYKSGNFGGPEVQGLFEGYLQNFENNMELIAVDYLANEQNGSHIIDFFNAQNASQNTTPMYHEEDIPGLVQNTLDMDLNLLQNEDLRNTILHERRLIAGKRAIDSLRSIYGSNEDVMNLLSAIIIVSVEGTGDEFDWSGINQMISEHNDGLGDNSQESLPLIAGDILTTIESTLTSLFEAETAAANYAAQLDRLDHIREEGEKIRSEVSRITQAIISTTDTTRIQALKGELRILTRQQSQQQREERMTELEADTAREDAEEIITDAEESIYSLSEIADIMQEKHTKIINSSRELIPEGISEENRPDYEEALDIYFYEYTFEEIIQKPTVRISNLTNPKLLKEFLIQYNTDQRLINTNFRNLPASHRNNVDIALAFPGKIDENDFPFMQASLLSNSRFIRSAIVKSINRGFEGVGIDLQDIGVLLQRYSASGGDVQEMVQILKNIFDTYPDVKTQINGSIPHSILNADNGNILGLEISDINLDVSSALLLLNSIGEIEGPNDYEGRVIPIFESIDKFLEINPGSQEIKLLLIEKGGLPHTTYLKGNLGLDRSTITWSHILEHDINSIRFLEEGTRRNSFFQENFVQSLPDSSIQRDINGDIRLGYLLQYIPLENPTEIYNFLQLLKVRFPEMLTGEDGDVNSAIYVFVGANEDFRGVITNYFEQNGIDGLSDEVREFVSQCIFSSAGLIGQTREAIDAFQNKNSNDLYGKAFESSLLAHEDFTDIFSGSEGKKELRTVMNILRTSSAVDINEGNGIILAEIFGENYPSFLDFCILHENEVDQEEIAKFTSKAIDGDTYPEEFSEFLIKNEDGEIVPNIETIDRDLIPLLLAQLRLNNISSSIERAEYTIQYLQDKHGLNQNQAMNWYDNLISRKLNKILRDQIDTNRYADALRNGEGSEYIRTVQRKVGNDAVLRMYPNASIDEEGNISIPSQSQQNLNTSEMGLDTLDTYREISTELMLTPEEQNSLTTEELNAIASSESVRESFIGFRSTLVELGLTELWKFRGDIFKAIGSLDFSVADGDYIGENEFNIFLSETVYATTGEKRLKPTPSNLESTKQIIREVNHQTGGPNDVDSVNTVGEAMTLVENNFREKFAPKDAGIISFNIGAFQKARRV